MSFTLKQLKSLKINGVDYLRGVRSVETIHEVGAITKVQVTFLVELVEMDADWNMTVTTIGAGRKQP